MVIINEYVNELNLNFGNEDRRENKNKWKIFQICTFHFNLCFELRAIISYRNECKGLATFERIEFKKQKMRLHQLIVWCGR